MRKIELDIHTHTIASGHAYGTIAEMARAAAEKEIQILGITDHAEGIPGTCDNIYFSNLQVIPRQMFGIELMLGAEINILDYQGTLSLEQKYIDYLDIRIAGIHHHCYVHGSIEENTQAVILAIQNPSVDIISHPDDGFCPLNYEAVVLAAKKYHTLLEINNNSLRLRSRLNTAGNSITILNLCRRYDQPVILSSDAHYMTDIANMDHIEPLLAQTGFPEELIINYRPQYFKQWIAENRKSAV